MFYFNGSGQPVQIFNKRRSNFSDGGYVKYHPKNEFADQDSIASWLEPGSLVIPTSVMESGVMSSYKGKLTDRTVHDTSKLANVIIMPGEFVVAKKYAPSVEKHLKKHGISLPLKE
jgi:hypothetical protein